MLKIKGLSGSYNPIGFWKKRKEDFNEFLWPISVNWDENEKKLVLKYISDPKKKYISYKGSSICRICSKKCGNGEMHDNFYVWPEGLIHYIKEHNVSLPREFIDYVKNKNQ